MPCDSDQSEWGSGVRWDYGPRAANYYGPYTSGYWTEYESFKFMAGFDGEVDSEDNIYYDFEIMYENGLNYGPYAMVNDRVIYKSTTGAEMYVVHGGDGSNLGCYTGYPGWMVVNPATLSEVTNWGLTEP